MIAAAVLESGPTGTVPLSTVKQVLPVQKSYVIGQLFSNTFPAIRIKVTNTNGPIANVYVELQLE